MKKKHGIRNMKQETWTLNFGSRNNGNVEVISGLTEGDLIVAEGLKKVVPKGKIKPIKK